MVDHSGQESKRIDRNGATNNPPSAAGGTSTHNPELGDSQVPAHNGLDRKRQQLENLAWWLDDLIPIPGLGIRVGLDGLLGLIPGVGDLITTGFSSYIIRQSAKLGVPKIVLLRMTFNTAIDFVLGSVPIVGDIFDIGWKENRRNVKL